MEGLKAVSIFQKLNDAELDQLTRIARQESFAPEKVIFFEGDRSDSLYVILAGSVRVFVTSDEGKEKVINTLGKGGFFGEIAMLDGEPRSASVVANEETTMLAIGHRDFRAFCDRQPEVLWKVLATLTDRIRKIGDELLDMSFRDVPYRVLRKLNTLARQHGEQRLDGLRINFKLSPEILAGMVGANTERTSRILHKYEEEKLIRREGDYYLVLDATALERSLEYEKDWA